MSPILFIFCLSLFAWLAFVLGTFSRPKITVKEAASVIGKLGRQTQLRTQAEKTRARHAQLAKEIGRA